MTKRFDALGIESTEENRRDYRELLLTTPRLGDFISGVILYDETIRQQAADGDAPSPGARGRSGSCPGIKVDAGAKPLAGSPDEHVTEGLDGLRDRLAEYRRVGARFAKWRADVRGRATCCRAPAASRPTPTRWLATPRSARRPDLVPIVEPEVLMDGAHSIERCER